MVIRVSKARMAKSHENEYEGNLQHTMSITTIITIIIRLSQPLRSSSITTVMSKNAVDADVADDFNADVNNTRIRGYGVLASD